MQRPLRLLLKLQLLWLKHLWHPLSKLLLHPWCKSQLLMLHRMLPTRLWKLRAKLPSRLKKLLTLPKLLLTKQ